MTGEPPVVQLSICRRCGRQAFQVDGWGWQHAPDTGRMLDGGHTVQLAKALVSEPPV